MASEAQPSPSTSWFCVTANGHMCWILPTSSPLNGVSPVDVPTKLKTDVANSSVSPVPEIRMDRWKRQRNVQGVLGVHVDLFGGGNLAFQKAVRWLRT